MKHMTLATTAVVALLFLLTVGAPHASADTFDLTSCHISTGCPTAGTSFGSVTLTQSGTSVLFDVTLINGNRFVETGFGFLAAFNDTVATSQITGITATLNTVVQTIPGGLSGTTNSSFNADGFADHSAAVFCTTGSSCNGGSIQNINDLHFTVSNETIAQLTTGTAFFLADILCGSTVTGCAGQTGLVDASTPSVPDGGMTLMLLGGALAGLETLRRKFAV
jgi:hypothetical protein